MIAGTKVKMVVYFRGDFGEKFFAKVIYKLRWIHMEKYFRSNN